jgi:hypothetical protein
VVHWVEIAKWAKNGPKMGQKWAKNGHSVENFFVSEESRDFFPPSHTTTYSGPKINKSVPRHCLRRDRLNLAVQGELPCFLIWFINETMLVFNL